ISGNPACSTLRRFRGQTLSCEELLSVVCSSLSVALARRASAHPQTTGDDKTYKTVSLGTIELPPGQASFEIRGADEGWKPIQIRKVTLKPAK
ncbi:MAG: hypothetical protein NTV46_15490, partial [Verrucomicrobia bacterium]|nr:hypothetical protein [Verrucomicrobiota bacterium]